MYVCPFKSFQKKKVKTASTWEKWRRQAPGKSEGSGHLGEMKTVGIKKPHPWQFSRWLWPTFLKKKYGRGETLLFRLVDQISNLIPSMAGRVWVNAHGGVKHGWAMCFLFTNKMQHAWIQFCGGGSLSANKFTWGMSNRSGGAVTNPQSHCPNRCAGDVNAQSATGFIGSYRFLAGFYSIYRTCIYLHDRQQAVSDADAIYSIYRACIYL